MNRKVAVITGAAAGIGAACALHLARMGIAIGVLDLDVERCAETVAAVGAAGGEAIALGADVTSREQVQDALATCRKTLGAITILVNNAGVTDFTAFTDVTEALWTMVYRVNVLGTFIMTQEVLPDMRQAGWGRIVNLSSSGAQSGVGGMATYSSSKGAITTLTRSLAQELGPLGITVNNISPGSIMGTLMSESNRALFQSAADEIVKTMPVRRFGEPDDIANACAWLCQAETGYVTGQIIAVNGGRVVT